jgi:MFS transporter, ACS family, solute carrier family 17 (sodium-dependent inorganic phosphate cotransporter), other
MLRLITVICLLGIVQSSAFVVSQTSSSCTSNRRPTHTINPLRSQHGHERFSLQQQVEEESQLENTVANAPIRVDDENSTSKINNITTPQPLQTINQQTIDAEFYPILALCFCVTLLSALDRVAMSIAILPISAEFGYSETIKGQISSAVSYGYGAAILPIGLAVSVVSTRLLMMVGVFLWSLATLGTPLMAEFSSSGSILLPLISIRAVMGAAEAVVLPTMQRVLANWVPPEKKATTLAIILSGFQLGTVSAYLISPWLLEQMSGLDGGAADIEGWRGMFYIYGIAGLVWLVPWYFLAKDSPSTNSNISAEDCTETLVNTMIEDDASLVFQECPVLDVDGKSTKDNSAGGGNTFKRIQDIQLLVQSAPWSDFLTSRGVWGMTLAHAAKNWELYNLLAWTPTFFNEQYGLNTKESAIYSIAPSICGMIGGLTAGNMADYMLVKLSSGDSDNIATETRTNVRKLFQSIALFGPAACLFLLSYLPEQATTAQILLGGAVGLQAMDAAGFGAATQEKAGERWAGLLYSLTSLPGVMIGSISVSVTGQILDMMSGEEGSGWTTVFQLNSLVCVAGAFCFLFLYDSKKEFG